MLEKKDFIKIIKKAKNKLDTDTFLPIDIDKYDLKKVDAIIYNINDVI